MTTMTLAAMSDIQRHLETVRPGMPFRISDAADVGDGVWQGDLCLEIVAAVPDGYEHVNLPKAGDKQLVPGQTQGSRHCLKSLKGVKIYRPANWGADLDALAGPCLVLSDDATVLHPTHGAVTIPAGRTILCSYQRTWDAEQRKQRRSLD